MAESLTWTVTDEDGLYDRTYPGEPSGPDVEWAMDAEDAATMWAEWACQQEAEYPDERIALVTDADGNVTRWIVECETQPVFFARKVAR